jgi:glycosyltransferase involved in cell wall biosynthesis
MNRCDLRAGERTMSDFCVCILAYNEQKHIADTIHAILAGNGDMDFDVIVYANGCTDKTADVVRGLCEKIPNLRLRELAKASKPNAWNTAFTENTNPILFFSDGDARPEPGSVAALQRYFDERAEVSLVCSQFWPDYPALTFEQRLTGFLLTPLAQDYHSGLFYAVRRSHVMARLKEKGLEGIPQGIVGEDEFLDALMPRHAFLVARERAFYEPPLVADYWKFHARLRWQEEQRIRFYGKLLDDQQTRTSGMSRLHRLARKLTNDQGAARTIFGLMSATMRTAVNLLFRPRINRCYRNLGPVCREGRNILSHATRSESAK